MRRPRINRTINVTKVYCKTVNIKENILKDNMLLLVGFIDKRTIVEKRIRAKYENENFKICYIEYYEHGRCKLQMDEEKFFDQAEILNVI